jgi:hypothetical protein
VLDGNSLFPFSFSGNKRMEIHHNVEWRRTHFFKRLLVVMAMKEGATILETVMRARLVLDNVMVLFSDTGNLVICSVKKL